MSSSTTITFSEPAATIKTEGKELDVLQQYHADLKTNINGNYNSLTQHGSLPLGTVQQASQCI